MAELKYWVWLASLQGVRRRVKYRLIEHLGDVRRVYFSCEQDYAALDFLDKSECEALMDKSLDFARRTVDICADSGITILTRADAAYPLRLTEIDDPPLALYVRGRLPDIDGMCAVAVVGTRKASEYGLKMAEKMGYGITKCGGLVISGLTRGVDDHAARGALLAGGACVGVLGVAIDAVGEDDGLAREVERGGALVSEYAPGTRRSSYFFRERNRITSGLSVATLVIEAPARSGALLFADEAMSQGREVFAVPANADSVTAEGSNRLIIDGASPAVDVWNVLGGFSERFPNLRRSGAKPPEEAVESAVRASVKENAEAEEAGGAASEGAGSGGKKAKKGLLRRLREKKDIDKAKDEEYIDLQKQLSGLSETQLAIVSAITQPHTHVDDIIERAGLPAAAVLSELTMLQVLGYISQEPGKRFSLNITSQK